MNYKKACKDGLDGLAVRNRPTRGKFYYCDKEGFVFRSKKKGAKACAKLKGADFKDWEPLEKKERRELEYFRPTEKVQKFLDGLAESGIKAELINQALEEKFFTRGFRINLDRPA